MRNNRKDVADDTNGARLEPPVTRRRERTHSPPEQPPTHTSRALPNRRAVLLGALAIGGFGVAYGVTKLTARGPAGMVWIPGGEFTMGSADLKLPANERPAHKVRTDGFWIDTTEVTNTAFRAFVDATGYVTTAEK